ncbi:hypothetical protein NFO65_04350 [Neorhizobium galegae]|uniref:hypothetical protein n=1 Tax=Neorhizobium galegae TaxID=399 RepID=UPI0006211C17|nr:hypothetical protein [Neorhizobium galegae]MCQ1569972.1 hypothetical protein [Neorhizobium galegae]MCQ1838081.1 hypothetical protein [Neorhizobium galegae]CDZ56981.1 Hypothetical protein NGAL_HAMBI2566_15330 [Neorhizobium galegae bv. orientalis]CDZ62229.1 Hypothetical protein NGAL_HAMBI2605_18480 [Neorhizobium galegae bv. orientalis]
MAHQTADHILVFLPEGAAALVSSGLNDVGYIASVARSVSGLRQALRSPEYRLVVTSRSAIDTVRDIKPLPVVNLEIFFHPDPRGTSLGIETKKFDSKAFLSRVKALTEPGRTRELPLLVKTAASTRTRSGWQGRLLRFWTLAERAHDPF